jgi:hypothetical protein
MRPLIRDASPHDIPALLNMLRKYRANMPYGFLQDADDAEHVTQLLTNLMAGHGIVLVAETDQLIGLVMAGIMPSLWSPKHFMLTEFAYWVEPEHRGGTAGYRLLNQYLEQGIKLKEDGRVCHIFLSKMVNSPDLSYERFGFRKLEEFWVM